MMRSRVEERRGGGRLPVAMAGAFAAAPQSGLPWPRFHSPLIEPDVPISGIWLLESASDIESAYGYKQTWRRRNSMSALPPGADIPRPTLDFRL